jgi:hypothetical protein
MADSLRGYGSFSNPRGHPSPCSAQPGDSDTPCLSARGCGCRARPKGLDRRYRQVHLPVPIPLSDGTVGAPGDTAGPAGRRAPSTAHDPFTTFFSVRPAIFRLLGLLGTESLHPSCLGPLSTLWNMADLEISALQRQGLDRRIGDLEILRREVAAWVRRRNEAAVTVHGRFTSRQAREKLNRSYPKIIP